MSMHRLNARIFAVGGIVVGQLGVLTAVLNARLAGHSIGWVAAVELACFLAAAVLGGTAPRTRRSAPSEGAGLRVAGGAIVHHP